ncbi:hypothetical protein RI054_02g13000 [Pseudoscourfieldia marina]
MADLPSNDEHHRSTSLMSLPPDILDKIFEKVVAGRGGSFKRLKYFSHVCRATREYTENNFAQFQLERMALAITNFARTNTTEGLLNKYIDGGGDVDAKVNNFSGGTLLHVAARYNNHSICKLLLENSANVNQQSINGDTPLHIAAWNNAYDICDLLILQNIANVNLQNEYGETPLHLAAEAGHDAVIELLLDLGAETSIRDNQGKTASDVCDADSECYILLGGDASELDSESESDESEVSGSHSSWDSDDS